MYNYCITYTVCIGTSTIYPPSNNISQSVALFSVDAEKEKLQVKEFHRGGTTSKLSRARSLQNIK